MGQMFKRINYIVLNNLGNLLAIEITSTMVRQREVHV